MLGKPLTAPAKGLSPRVRGNRARKTADGPCEGSIPARAGEPWWSDPGSAGARVYPRACGGTDAPTSPGTPITGLSPRVRGNPVGTVRRPFDRGSIPARAGEPIGETTTCWRSRVYPRACGGTLIKSGFSANWGGLSPRVRGNRMGRRARGRRAGSIPARAGEPDCDVRPDARRGVYPRACGGTVVGLVGASLMAGLSPRVRGNQSL